MKNIWLMSGFRNVLFQILAFNIISKTNNSKSKIIYTSLPQDDPKQRRPDISKAIEILSWSPKIDRKYGIEKPLNYFKSLPKGEKNKLHKTFNKIHD